jgi:hypothetical protein
MIQDGMHLLSNGHFHAARFRELHCRVGCEDPFGHHAMHSGDNFGKFSTPAKLYSNAAIARQGSGASKNQIAQTGQS